MSITKIPVLCYTRVVGYFAPVSHWNRGKKEEFKDRKYYKLTGEFDEKETHMG